MRKDNFQLHGGMDMLVITEAQVEQVLPVSLAIDVVEQAFRDYAADMITMGKRGTLALGSGEGNCIFLPALHKTGMYYAIKYAASFPGFASKGLPTVQSLIWLFSAQTGEVLAMIHANALTAIKTGAATGVATQYLSNENAEILVVIGAGNQARTQLAGVLAVRQISEIRLVDLDSKKCLELKNWIQANFHMHIPIKTVTSSKEAVSDADIIITCTTSARPVLRGVDIKPGVHINAIGSFTPQMQEIDEQVVIKSNRIVADSVKEAWDFSGDLMIPLDRGIINKDLAIEELGNIILGQSKGRMDAGDITLYESVGFAPLDLAVAIAVFKRVSNS